MELLSQFKSLNVEIIEISDPQIISLYKQWCSIPFLLKLLWLDL